MPRRHCAIRRCWPRCAATRRARWCRRWPTSSPPCRAREKFREAANRVKARTGQKGKALFHPIRVVLTGRAEGPELDLAVPAIDRGAELPIDAGVPTVLGNRERADRFARALDAHR